jgi:DNA-binding NarL/FixJ family response regulator
MKGVLSRLPVIETLSIAGRSCTIFSVPRFRGRFFCATRTRGFSLASVRLLLVDDDESVRSGLQGVLEAHEFEVTTAANVNEALKHITSESFDVLLSDLHMPGPGDGLTVVSAMRHAHPQALTIVLSANPDMAKACAAILKQADEVIRKPVQVGAIVEVIRQRLSGEMAAARPPSVQEVETIAGLLERETAAITAAWLGQMESVEGVGSGWPGVRLAAPLTREERCEHLPDALRDIIFRLRYPQAIGSTSVFSMAALQHGARRRRQGIGAATLVEEARALQIALFRTIEAKMGQIDAGELPGALMAIADEVNAQLLQGLAGYENEQPMDVPWGFR